MTLLGREGGCRPAVRGYGLAGSRGAGSPAVIGYGLAGSRGGIAGLQSGDIAWLDPQGRDLQSCSQGIWPGWVVIGMPFCRVTKKCFAVSRMGICRPAVRGYGIARSRGGGIASFRVNKECLEDSRVMIFCPAVRGYGLAGWRERVAVLRSMDMSWLGQERGLPSFNHLIWPGWVERGVFRPAVRPYGQAGSSE
ncbi:hypothetical protein DPMN_156217 [Dreissena polymorpha]|uniref:Uncharacterized protein n=1 Tax=Dreissena polymorpha TaxID=45954 RepID=A0A9D4FNM1_DREPO|nr:hypothetical protein DPMN_156217 [Dreissena polymorpha]